MILTTLLLFPPPPPHTHALAVAANRCFFLTHLKATVGNGDTCTPQKEGVRPGTLPGVPVPWLWPGPCPAPPGAGAGPERAELWRRRAGGRERGGRSRCKMAAQRRSLLQSVSGIFPPSEHTHPPGGCEGVPGPPPHPPPALPCGKGEVPPPRAVGRCSPAPCAALGQGPALRGSRRGQRPTRCRTGRSAARGGPQVAGGPCRCCGLRGARCVRGQLAPAGLAGDGGPRDVSHCWLQHQAPVPCSG